MPYLLRYVPEPYNTWQMCDKTVLQNGGILKSVPDFYKNQEMCNKAINNYPHALELVPECYNPPKKIRDSSVDTYPSTIKFASECFMAQEMYDKAVNRCFLYFIVFLINIKIKKYVTVLFLRIFFQ